MAPAAAASAAAVRVNPTFMRPRGFPDRLTRAPRAPRVPSTRRPVPNRRRVTQHRATAMSAGEPGDDDAVVEAETSLFESFASLPFAAGASLHRDPRDPSRLTLRVTTSQRDLVANRSRRSVAAMNVDKDGSKGASTPLYHPPFGTEERGVLASSVSPSGNKRMVVRSGKDDGDRGADVVCVEIWEGGALAAEMIVFPKTHGAVCVDGTFGGISWSAAEGRVAYVAEAPAPDPTPEWPSGVTVAAVDGSDGDSTEASEKKKKKKGWRGKGRWREEWGEQLVGRVEPAVFVLDIADGRVTRVAGLAEHGVAASGPVWAPMAPDTIDSDALVCPVWRSNIDNFDNTSRRLGLVFCFNRPSAAYLAHVPLDPTGNTKFPPVLLTRSTRSALWPRFSPDGDVLVWFSHERAVESGAHFATVALCAMPWRGHESADAVDAAVEENRDIVPVVDAPERPGGFPGLYVSSPPPDDPWLLPDSNSRSRMVLQTTWGAGEAIVEVDVTTGTVRRMTPAPSDGGGSWTLCDAKDGVVAAIRSDPGSIPSVRIAWGDAPTDVDVDVDEENAPRDADVDLARGLDATWKAVVSGFPSTPAASAALDACANLTHRVVEVRPGEVESVVVRSRSAVASGERLPTIVLPHGGPHANCGAAYVTSTAYLASLGYAVCYCNYRGSTGYGDDALQSLVGGAAGRADVDDCVAVAERAVADGVADPKRLCAVGGSHGGFLAAHLVGQRPDLFRCAVLRNPVTDIAAMVPSTDIPDWCFVETLGREAYSDLPSPEALAAMRDASPVRYVNEVAKHDRGVLMLLGGVDLRVPPTNGLRYAASLTEAGGRCEVRMFPEDSHGLLNPRTEFESFVTVAGFLRRNV